MAGELITLPLRISIRGVQFLLRTTEEVASRAAVVAGRVLGSVRSEESSTTWPSEQPRAPQPPPASSTEVPVQRPPRPGPAVPEIRPAVVGESVPGAPVPGPPVPGPPVPEVRAPVGERTPPAHVSEDAELVREVAEAGAEDGAGAEVTVEAPWEGYEHMSARAIVARLPGATAAELAAVSLYESGHRGRHTVLTAVDRALKTTSGRPRPYRKEQPSA
jgi:hypothetical protein